MLKKYVKKLSDEEIDFLFMQYLDTALIELEQPHKKSEIERLDVYRKSFRKVIKELDEKMIRRKA